ncbi:hypothetical protein BYT27DRAFT_7214653 [Phlegmacium glaucopus]|nr:hypothetical protein BYT27DRAFT_7214653 [Phlegmacium glaucopus]
MYGIHVILDAGPDGDGLEERMSFVCRLLKRLMPLVCGDIFDGGFREEGEEGIGIDQLSRGKIFKVKVVQNSVNRNSGSEADCFTVDIGGGDSTGNNMGAEIGSSSFLSHLKVVKTPNEEFEEGNSNDKGSSCAETLVEDSESSVVERSF